MPLENVAGDQLAECLARVTETSPQVAALGLIETTLVTGWVPTRILEVADRFMKASRAEPNGPPEPRPGEGES